MNGHSENTPAALTLVLVLGRILNGISSTKLLQCASLQWVGKISAFKHINNSSKKTYRATNMTMVVKKEINNLHYLLNAYCALGTILNTLHTLNSFGLYYTTVKVFYLPFTSGKTKLRKVI